MSDVTMTVEFESPEATFRPGEHLRGRARVSLGGNILSELALRVRLRWFTSGRGDVEEAWVHDERLAVGAAPYVTGEVLEVPFEVEMPPGPFSVSGRYVNLKWELEVRLVVRDAVDPVHRQPVVIVPGPCESYWLGPRTHAPLEPPSSQLTKGRSMAFLFYGGAALGSLGFGVYLMAWLKFPWVFPTFMVWLFGSAVVTGVVAVVVGKFRPRLGAVDVPVDADQVLVVGSRLDTALRVKAKRDITLERFRVDWVLEECAYDTSRGPRGEPNMYLVERKKRAVAPTEHRADIRAGEVFELPLQLEVPDEPSFRGRYNLREWRLEVAVFAADDVVGGCTVPVVLRPPPANGASGTERSRSA